MKWTSVAAALAASIGVHAIALGSIPATSPNAGAAAALAGPCECDYEIQVADGEQPVAALVAPRAR
jgi:hypothetical protein